MSNEHLARLNALYSYVDGCLVCETCSTQEHAVYMSPLGHNMLWQCPKCQHLVMVLLSFHAGRSHSYDSSCKKCKELSKQGFDYDTWKEGHME